MGYTLENFAAECRAALEADSGPGGRENVRACVVKALKDEEFVAKHLGDDAKEDRDVIYEDPDFEFCICAHVNRGAKQGEPHDHGPTWAIYGQAVGETEMTDWEMVSQPEGDNPGKVKMTKSYRLKPGDAHLYEPGAIHAPMRDGPTRLIRIEGKDTRKLKRTRIEAVS